MNIYPPVEEIKPAHPTVKGRSLEGQRLFRTLEKTAAMLDSMYPSSCFMLEENYPDPSSFTLRSWTYKGKGDSGYYADKAYDAAIAAVKSVGLEGIAVVTDDPKGRKCDEGNGSYREHAIRIRISKDAQESA